MAGMGHGHGHHENIGTDWDSIKWDELTEEEKWNYEQLRMHSSYHADLVEKSEMDMMKLKIWIVVCIASQICLTLWKKWRAKSYHVATLIAMWIFPLGDIIANHSRRFVCIWLVFSFITSMLTKRSLGKPRHFYKAFLLIHKIYYFIFIFGFFATIAAFLYVLPLIFVPLPLSLLGLHLIIGVPLYALYFERHLEKDICAVCGKKLSASVNPKGASEETFLLSCGHEFHKNCIRGWFNVGNKQSCPYCHEKLDLKRIFIWEKPQLFYSKMLSCVRWLVWQPVVYLLVKGIFYIFFIPVFMGPLELRGFTGFKIAYSIYLTIYE